MHLGIDSGLTYPEWKEAQRKAKAEHKKEAFREFAESIVDSAIFYSRKFCGRKSCSGYGCDIRGVFKRIREIIASILFFAVLIFGLNFLALIM